MFVLATQTAAYKGSGKRTYAERARELGLGPAAMEVLQGSQDKLLQGTQDKFVSVS